MSAAPGARLHRLALRIAYRLYRRAPRLFRRRRQAAVVALWSRGELLLVRHSYRKGWALPGGGARRHETLPEAARRELREETGIDAPVDALVAVFTTIPVRIFEYCPVARPVPRPDGREILEARFADPYAQEGLARYVRNYLLSRPVQPGR